MHLHFAVGCATIPYAMTLYVKGSDVVQTATKRLVCLILAWVLMVSGMVSVSAATATEEYYLSSTPLRVGSNTVTAADAPTTLYLFTPTHVGYYRVTVDDPNATVSFWYGSAQYVSQPADSATDGGLRVTCTAVGQRLIIGLSGVAAATITIEEEEGYVAPPKVVYETYRNLHRPSWRFNMTTDPLTAVDITKSQTVVADTQGIYHLNSVDGPTLYVNMRASIWTDLYLWYYPEDVEGEEWPPVDVLRGRREVTDTAIYCYDFVEAMADYADALDDGYYYLTVDLANFIQMYGRDQGWFVPQYSPFDPIREGAFIEESAWLVNVYYVSEDPVPGDVNEDGKVNLQDLAVLQRYLNGWDVTINTEAGDTDGNGKVNIQDLALLQRYLNGWDVELN